MALVQLLATRPLDIRRKLGAMPSERPPLDGGRPPRKPLHIHVSSLTTNASGIAESLVSNNSDLSGISEFPAPPLQVPTPTLSSSTTPTTTRFADRFTPTAQDHRSQRQLAFGTPSTPRSPIDSQFSGNVNDENGVGKGHYSAQLGQIQDARDPTQTTSRTAEVQGSDHYNSYSISPSGPGPSRLQPLGPRRPSIKESSRPQQVPPSSTRKVENRPASPLSTVAPSSFVDWTDNISLAASGISGISVNPSEEALLTTSFITSLLSNSPEPFPDRKLSTARRNLVRQLDKKKGDASSQISGLSKNGHRAAAASADTHQSVPASVAPYYPSDDVNAVDVPTTAKFTASISDQESIIQQSTVDHSEDGLIQLVTRRPTISYVLGGTDKRPVGVVPAYRLSVGPSDSSYRTSMNSGLTSSSLSSKPPGHRADAPRDIGLFDSENGPRESEEDFAKIGGVDLIAEKPEGPTSPALASTVGSKSRYSNLDPRHRSFMNASPASALPSAHKEARSSKNTEHPLQRSNSKKSIVSSLVSRISHTSDRYVNWLRNRPLPPLPLMPTNHAPEIPNSHEIRTREESIPLPTLARRADHLQVMLNRGRYPTSSGYDSQYDYKQTPVDEEYMKSTRHSYAQIRATGTDGTRRSVFSRFRRKEKYAYADTSSPTSPKILSLEQKKRRRRKWIIIICVIIGIILCIVIPVAITESKKSSSSNCSGNLTGASCTLDATCVCVGTGTCKPLANDLYLLVSNVNSLFAANFTAGQLSDAVTSMVESSMSDCSKQAVLVDVEPNLDSAASPNRTLWAQSAILWNIGMSEDITATQTLQKFVSTAPWSSLNSSDGTAEDASQKFAITASGYTFDFLEQLVTPLNASFKDASPSSDQLAEVPDDVVSTLDRMYSYGIASSTQRENALENYWTNKLQQQQDTLDTFRIAIQNSAFLLPFDATSSPGGHDLTTLMTNSSSTAFPPPISCYPGLNSSQIDRINSLETPVFGLEAASSVSDFNSSSFPYRPVYGVVDILRMRMPFPDAREGVGLQAAAISQDAKIRAIVYSGEFLSALPGTDNLPSLTSSSTDPREFGTINFMDHVLLNYLSSFSNTTLTNELVSFVLSSSSAPPSNTSDLGQAVSTTNFPVIEFALFGTVKPQDIASSVSSFSTPSGGLFFGSDEGETFREWALVNTSTQVDWAQNALSSEAVNEGSETSSAFESVWSPASELVGEGSTNSSDVDEVVSSLQSLGLFSS